MLDVAHNVDGIKQLVQQIEVTEHNELHIIIGMVKDKEVEKVWPYFQKMQLIILPKHKYPGLCQKMN